MSASEKDSLINGGGAKPNIEKLGILAGGGELPAKLVASCKKRGIKPFIVGFPGHTDPALMEGNPAHIWSRLGAAGQIIMHLKTENIKDLVFIGHIRRPSMSELQPDFWAMKFFARLGVRTLGDNDLLSALKKELGREGFHVHGVQDFIDNLLTPKGVLTKAEPDSGHLEDMEYGRKIAKEIGRLDIGQSVIVQEGLILGVEAIEGTDELIRRCGKLKREGRAPILIKICKPQQDEKLDLPTIGHDTVLNAVQEGFAGIAISAGHSLLLDAEKVIESADNNGLFIVGF